MDFTLDSIISPDIHICQPADGFRFGTDSILLADFVPLKDNLRVIDIGSGSGIISLLLALRNKTISITAVELQDIMYHCLCETININHLNTQITPIHADINKYKPDGRFDIAVCNPPYRGLQSGRISQDEVNLKAKFENSLDLENILNFSKSHLSYKGKLLLSGEVNRLMEYMETCRNWGFEPKRLRFLHSDINRQAKLFFLETVYGGKMGVKIEPPYIQTESKSDNTCFNILHNSFI